MEDKIIEICLGIGLFLCAVTDWKEQKVYAPVISIISVILCLLQWKFGNLEIKFVLGILLIGLFFWGLRVISRGQIGEGDIFLFMMSGIGLGSFRAVLLIILTFLLLFIESVILLLFCKKKKDTTLPVAPSLFTGYLLLLLLF